jgi:hypothetical protein
MRFERDALQGNEDRRPYAGNIEAGAQVELVGRRQALFEEI